MKKIFLALFFCFGLMFVSATPLALNDTSPTNLVTDVKIQKNIDVLASDFVAVENKEKINFTDFSFSEKATILNFTKNYLSGDILQHQFYKNYDLPKQFIPISKSFNYSNKILNDHRNIFALNYNSRVFQYSSQFNFSKIYNLPKNLKSSITKNKLSFLPQKEYLVSCS